MNFLNIKSAVVSGLIMALIIVLTMIINAKSIFLVDWRNLIDVAIISFLTSIVSVLKSLSTTAKGNFLGVKIK